MFLLTGPIKCTWFRSSQNKFKFWWPSLILCPRNVKVRLIIWPWWLCDFSLVPHINPTAVMKPIMKQQQQKSKPSGESYWSQGIPIRKGNITVLRGFHSDSLVHFHWLHILNQAKYKIKAVSNWRDCPVYKEPWDRLLLLTQWRYGLYGSGLLIILKNILSEIFSRTILEKHNAPGAYSYYDPGAVCISNMVLFFNLDYKSSTKSAKSNPFPDPFILKEVHEDENGSREEAGK